MSILINYSYLLFLFVINFFIHRKIEFTLKKTRTYDTHALIKMDNQKKLRYILYNNVGHQKKLYISHK